MSGEVRVGIIADTHGLLRPAALDYLRGADHIVHAGDIGTAAVLDALRALAVVTAVRGNNDGGRWAKGLKERESIRLGGMALHALHDLADLGEESLPPETRVIVSGHSHRPQLAVRAGRLYLNPGSAGPRRFTLPLSVAELRIADRGLTARIVDLASAKLLASSHINW